MGRSGYRDLLIGTEKAMVVSDHVCNLMREKERQRIIISSSLVHRPPRNRYGSTRHGLDQNLRCIQHVHFKHHARTFARDPKELRENPVHSMSQRMCDGQDAVLLSLNA